MFARATVKTPQRQQGLAVLVLVIIILLAFISYAFSDLSIVQVKVDQAKQTQIALKKAKQALINYALVETDIDAARSGQYGFLPCPDYTSALDEGVQDGNCGTANINIMGWLPSITLGLPRLRDSSGSCLLYAVSGEYKQSPETGMLNEDTNGRFQVVDDTATPIEGIKPEDRIVAIVFAPGEVLSGQGQSRTFESGSYCGNDYGNESEYLEGDGTTENAMLGASASPDAIDQFIRATSTSTEGVNPYNDKFISITRAELWKEIVTRNDFTEKMRNLTQALAMCLAEYANMPDNNSRRLPWPALTDLGDRINYRDNNNYVDINSSDINFNGYSGRFPFKVTNSNAAIAPGILTEDEIFNITGLCNSLDVGGGVVVDLETVTSEYRKLWNNWKDHFFYVLSKEYEPANSSVAHCVGSAPCIKIKKNAGLEKKFAAAVIFSGNRLPGITRNNKETVADYLEDGKAAVFEDEMNNKTGKETYSYTDPQTATENDVMYCIEDKATGLDLTVTECS